MFFQLADPKRTDYGTPHRRDLNITFVNEDSNYQTTATITLAIPQLDTTAETVELTSSNKIRRVHAVNISKDKEDKSIGELKIDIVPVLTSATEADRKMEYAKFSGIVETTLGVESTGTNAGEPYVEFKLKAKGCVEDTQVLHVYSNGDSKGGADNCDIKAGDQHLGRSNESRWNTTSCKKITVTMPGVDLNADGKVNIQDLVMETDTTTADYQKADVDGSGEVDHADLAVVSSCFGES